MNLKKITDEALYQGSFVFGNENDKVNFINRVAPSFGEEVEDIFEKLASKGVKSSDKIFFVLGNEEIEGSILNYPLNGLILSFRKA